MKPWTPGDPAPERPSRRTSPSEVIYQRDMERYADNLERMLVFFGYEFAQMPNRIKAAMDDIFRKQQDRSQNKEGS